jgi:hypothetical protein
MERLGQVVESEEELAAIPAPLERESKTDKPGTKQAEPASEAGAIDAEPVRETPEVSSAAPAPSTGGQDGDAVHRGDEPEEATGERAAPLDAVNPAPDGEQPETVDDRAGQALPQPDDPGVDPDSRQQKDSNRIFRLF